MNSERFLLLTALWFLLAVGWGLLGLQFPIPPPLFILSLSCFLAVLFWRWRTFRLWAINISINALVLVHLTRFVGFYFLFLYSRGELPYAFAVPGGIGDIVVAAAGGAIVIINVLRDRVHRRLVIVWNVLGLLDILFVVLTAGRFFLSDPQLLKPLTVLPLLLLPTFLVPIIITTHALMLGRLYSSKRTPEG